ncbi:hypothetical protein EPN52_12705 [bacterium]|nr:MAG: hypothetical protein EPN52_12705 [bacterium]
MDRVRFVPLGEKTQPQCWNCKRVVVGVPDARYLYRVDGRAVTEAWYRCDGCGAYVNVRREGVLHVERAARST